MKPTVSLSYLFRTFLKIGAVSWGGHLSLVSMARQNLVDKDNIMTDQQVVESLSLAAILPGPMAVNIVSYWGWRLRGWKGAIISAVAVLLPAFIAICALSFLYFKYAHLVVFKSFFKGIMPAVAAILCTTGISMSKKNKMDLRQWLLLLLSVGTFTYTKGYWASIICIISGAILGYLLYSKKLGSTEEMPKKSNTGFAIVKYVIVYLIVCTIVYFVSSPIQKALESQFAFISLSQIGGGYVVIPSMEKIFVGSLHWLTHQEFVDGIALSQITPGPIFIIAAFVGYKMDKLPGSLVATLAVYIPSALLMICTGNLYGKLQNKSWVKAAFKGIQPVVIGMIFSAALGILLQYNILWIGAILFILGLVLLLKTKIPAPAVLLGMGVLGIILFNK